eukprot:GHVU01192343.1.p1 GENE.GHVU01192343.1~~GHVU01192343.1.p1  ORF type:complete len:337 (+),score=12.42 GHVU01192343.1:695-1705(+)
MPALARPLRLALLLGAVLSSMRCPLTTCSYPSSAKLNAYYINLDRSRYRNSMIRRSMASYFNLTRIPAATPDMLHALCAETNRNATDGHATDALRAISNVSYIGELALSMSHLRAIKAAYDSGHEHSVILEDDASPIFLPYQPLSIKEIGIKADNERPGWLAVHLSRKMCRPTKGTHFEAEGKIPQGDHHRLVDWDENASIGGAYAMLWSRRGLASVLAEWHFPYAPRFRCSSREAPLITDSFLLEHTRPPHWHPQAIMLSLSERHTGVRANNATNTWFHRQSTLDDTLHVIRGFRPARLREEDDIAHFWSDFGKEYHPRDGMPNIPSVASPAAAS